MPINITTAVDSLVALLNERKRISLEDAAKELGLPENIINEWATFLEEENILTIEYQFATPFLVIKEKKEEGEKEDYSRDIEIILRNLDIIIAGLKKIDIKHKIEIKDIKELLSKKSKIDNDVIYAQKFILEYQVNGLINKIKKLKKITKKDYDQIIKEFEDIKKRRSVFDKNIPKIE